MLMLNGRLSLPVGTVTLLKLFTLTMYLNLHSLMLFLVDSILILL